MLKKTCMRSEIALREEIVKEITDKFLQISEIISLYLYGSVLTLHFVPKKSDIDILIISKDVTNPFKFIEKIKKISQGVNLKLDVNVVFYSEFKERWHIYRPPSYFLGIKYRSVLLFGEDLLCRINDKEVSYRKVYKRVVDLAQSSRSIYLNDKNCSFWEEKYFSWLRIAILEVLFLMGEFELSFDKGIKKILRKDKKLNFVEVMTRKKISMKEFCFVAENLRIFLLSRFPKKYKR